MSSEADPLDAVREELDALLEDRISSLLGQVRAAREVTRRVVAIDHDIARHESQSEQLADELGALRGRVGGSIVAALEQRAEDLLDATRRLRDEREQLVGELGQLTGALKAAGLQG